MNGAEMLYLRIEKLYVNKKYSIKFMFIYK